MSIAEKKKNLCYWHILSTIATHGYCDCKCGVICPFWKSSRDTKNEVYTFSPTCTIINTPACNVHKDYAEIKHLREQNKVIAKSKLRELL